MQHDFDQPEQELRSVLDAWRDSARSQSERPDWFWARQRARVDSQIGNQHSAAPRLAWAGIAAMAALAIAMFVPARQPQTIAPTPAAQVDISDHDLMIALERTMNSGVPSSLEPAGLLAREMNQALQNNIQTQKSKENPYED